MPTHINHLPEELLSQIIDHFDVLPPSARSCAEVATIEQLFHHEVPLKQLSCVSYFWRRLVFPVLFRHVRVALKDILPPPHYCPQVHLCQHDEDDREERPLASFAEKHNLSATSVSITVFQVDDSNSIMALGHRSRWKMWQRLVYHFDPQRLIIVAPPRVLGAIAGRNLEMRDAWAFRIAHQRLELVLASSWKKAIFNDEALHTTYAPDHPSPFHFRPWDTLTYHGGSCLPAFGEYHYFEKTPPCLLKLDEKHPLGGFRCLASNLKHLTYRAVFPHLTHMRDLSLTIRKLHCLNSLTLALTPIEHSTLLDDLDLIGRGNLNLRDCWSEVERSYRILISLCLEPGSPHASMPSLETFISLDCRKGALYEEVKDLMAAHAHSWDTMDTMTWRRLRLRHHINEAVG